MNTILKHIVSKDELHCKWLNTLSFMENCGARKISYYEDKNNVSIIQLKHAAEEHRHAYYLKREILKINKFKYIGYNNDELLAPLYSKQYLDLLDIKICKILKHNYNLDISKLRYAAYLFVTYVIELRADYIYPLYQDILNHMNSNITVKSIILEEEDHLKEMVSQLNEFDENWKIISSKIIDIENEIFDIWVSNIAKCIYK